MNRLKIECEVEKYTEVGFVDLMIGNHVIIEILGNIHFLNNEYDLKIQYHKKMANYWGYEYLVVIDYEFMQSSNKKKFIEDLFKKNDIDISKYIN